MQWLGAQLGIADLYFFGRLVTSLFYLTSRAKALVCIGPTPFPKTVDAKERVSTCWDLFRPLDFLI